MLGNHDCERVVHRYLWVLSEIISCLTLRSRLYELRFLTNSSSSSLSDCGNCPWLSDVFHDPQAESVCHLNDNVCSCQYQDPQGLFNVKPKTAPTSLRLYHIRTLDRSFPRASNLAADVQVIRRWSRIVTHDESPDKPQSPADQTSGFYRRWIDSPRLLA